MAENGIFCLEGEWDSDLRKRQSIEPLLAFLESTGEVKVIHRDVATVEEVQRYLRLWRQQRYNDYCVLYLAAHGDKGKIWWSSRNTSTLEDLAEALEDTAKGCYVYFGSCLTLFDREDVMRFAERTGARGVLGYRREVDWLESAAFDVLLLPWIANHYGRPKTMFNALMKRHGELARNLKFVVGTKNEVLRAQDWRLPVRSASTS